MSLLDDAISFCRRHNGPIYCVHYATDRDVKKAVSAWGQGQGHINEAKAEAKPKI